MDQPFASSARTEPGSDKRQAGAVERLRGATAADHDRVDAAFGAFALDERAGYRAFLVAQMRALAAVEAYLARQRDLPAWRPRREHLAADLAALGVEPPAALRFQPPASPGTAWGVLYVTEGSRLGGVLLARGVPEGWPAAFLRQQHRPGEWRGLLTRLDEEATASDAAWLDAAVTGARACFGLYEASARGLSAASPRSAR